MRAIRGACCVLLAMTLLSASRAAGSTVADFLARYSAAEPKLEQAYSHIRMTGLLTIADSKGRYSSSEQVEYLRSGKSARIVRTIIKLAAQPTMPAGQVFAYGDDASSYFTARKEGTDAKLRLTYLGISPHGAGWYMLLAPALGAPFFTDQGRVTDLLDAPGLKMDSADEGELDGQPVIELRTQQKIANGPNAMLYQDCYFLPRSLALAGWKFSFAVQPGSASVFQGRDVYEDPSQDLPRIKSRETWHEWPRAGNTRFDDRLLKLDRVEFVSLPKTDFMPAALGVVDSRAVSQGSTPPSTVSPGPNRDEPSAPIAAVNSNAIAIAAAERWIAWTLGVVVLLLGLFAGLRALARSKHKQ